MSSPDELYFNDPAFHELVDTLTLAVAGGQFPSFQFIRDAAEYAERLNYKRGNNPSSFGFRSVDSDDPG